MCAKPWTTEMWVVGGKLSEMVQLYTHHVINYAPVTLLKLAQGNVRFVAPIDFSPRCE